MRNAVYLPRTLEKSVISAAKQFPVVVITGPRCLSEEDVPLVQDVRAAPYMRFADRDVSVLDL
ncbi:MAG: hypothetical protein NTV79_06310 [Candidatus Aureabacteria bacterium]|nr:hypothetical protein [Candidatus Auribacterota bacterium]